MTISGLLGKPDCAGSNNWPANRCVRTALSVCQEEEDTTSGDASDGSIKPRPPTADIPPRMAKLAQRSGPGAALVRHTFPLGPYICDESVP